MMSISAAMNVLVHLTFFFLRTSNFLMCLMTILSKIMQLKTILVHWQNCLIIASLLVLI